MTNEFDDIQATNYMRELRYLYRDKRKNEEIADSQMQEIEAWLKNQNESINEAINGIEEILKEYYKRQRLEKGQYKLSTPWGTLSGRKQKPKIVRDNKKLLEWLQQSGRTEYIEEKIDYKPKWGELKEEVTFKENIAIDKNGEIVEGIELEEREPFAVNIKVEI